MEAGVQPQNSQIKLHRSTDRKQAIKTAACQLARPHDIILDCRQRTRGTIKKLKGLSTSLTTSKLSQAISNRT